MAQYYAIWPSGVDRDLNRLVRDCRRQGIDHVSVMGSVTGKLTATPGRLRECRGRLEAAGLRTSVLVFAVGHPNMPRYYGAEGRPPVPIPFYTGPRILPDGESGELLPAHWQYAVNEYGNPTYCCACLNQAWLEDNMRIAGELAGVFEEIWYDDEFRVDGDQGAGAPHTSATRCYCDQCLARLSATLGRPVTRQEIVADPLLHEAWIRDKRHQLTRGFEQIVKAAREVRSDVSVGLMVRWGGEERDGIDIGQLLPSLGHPPRLRAGEGHFGDAEYARPVSQVMEHLACAYHISWFPRETAALSETTYYAPVPRHAIIKKAALALAAGISELAYCPCVDGGIAYQWFIEHDRALLDRVAAAFPDKSALHRPIRILRGSAAGFGDPDPRRRAGDRMYIPWFSLAGLHSTVMRKGSWRDSGGLPAITGRSAWDCPPRNAGEEPLIVDGAALLEKSPLNDALGITHVRMVEGEGRVEVEGDYQRDGLMLRRGCTWIVPYVWHAAVAEQVPAILRDLRRTLGPLTGAAYLGGDLDVLLVHHRYPSHDSLLLVNLCQETRKITLHLPADRHRLTSWDGEPIEPSIVLGPHEIEVLGSS